MLGAIIGDIVGSRFEWHNLKSKEFNFFAPNCRPTDDSIMTFAVAMTLWTCKDRAIDIPETVVKYMQAFGQAYADAGYGGKFFRWLFSSNPKPYNSFGNGAAMRVSPCAWAASTLEDALRFAKFVTEVTHNHPEGLKGAAATTAAIFLARTGASKEDIRKHIEENYYKLDFTLDEIRPTYTFDVTCQGSVPQAIEAFIESTSFEDAIRNAISIGGDSDTVAAITGSIAEAYYGISDDIRNQALKYLDERQLTVLNKFESQFGYKKPEKN